MTQATSDNQALEEAFLDLFSGVEELLKTRLRLELEDTPVSKLIRLYANINPYWVQDSKDLNQFRRIRNVLTHARNEEHGFPIRVTRRSHRRLADIHAGLKDGVPISTNYRKDVVSVKPKTSLAEVLDLAYKLQFSQFPVIDDTGHFRGVVTENEVTRWLGRHIASKGTTVDLKGVVVSAVLKEKEPDRRKIPILRFVPLDKPEPEVMGLFMRYPMLEVVLLTQRGNKNEAIKGIVTQWDAARYSSG